MTISKETFRKFLRFLETNERSYKWDLLGFPWYYAVTEHVFNSATKGYHRVGIPSDEQKRIRKEDFERKATLLSNQYDFVFLSKPKMRWQDKRSAENLFFTEFIERITKRGKTYLILEAYSNDQSFDIQYLDSQHAEKTIPYEYLFEYLAPTISEQSGQFQQNHLAFVNDLVASFGNIPAEHQELFATFKQGYTDFAGLITHIILLKFLLQKFETKAFVGAMGSFMWTGLTNDHHVVEVAHGYIGGKLTDVTTAQVVHDYQKAAFQLDKFHRLIPSLTKELPTGECLCLESNRYNYGALELRSHEPQPEALSQLRNLYGDNGKSVLLCTRAFVETSDIISLVHTLHETDPEIKILLRPHPSYDKIERFQEILQYVHVVEDVAKYDLLSYVDAIISNPSSMISEACLFTDAVIVYPDKALSENSDMRFDVAQEKYPDAIVMDITDPKKIALKLQEIFAQKKTLNTTTDSLAEYADQQFEMLLQKIGIF